MLEAKKRDWGKIIFFPFVNILLRLSFSSFYLINKGIIFDNNSSILITPNHFSWWDGFFIHYICKIYIKLDFYIMMLEEQLKKFWYFRSVGAYSINPGSRKGVIESLNYTMGLLKKRSAVVMYPQGEIVPYENSFKVERGGLKYLSCKADHRVIPVAFKIHFTNKMKPIVLCNIGEELFGEFDNKKIDEYCKVMEKLKKELDNCVIDKSYLHGVKLF